MAMQEIHTLNKVCVYCGSSPGRRPEYVQSATDLAAILVARNIGLVYGGGNVGIMGVLANAVLELGGQVTGIIPQGLVNREVAHQGLTDLRVVHSMHERKALMAELSDAFIALPGGLGTIEELFEILTWAQLGLHRKPCGLLNVAGYYDTLTAFLNHAVAEEFVRHKHRAMLIIETNPETLLERFERYQAPEVTKWIGREAT